MRTYSFPYLRKELQVTITTKGVGGVDKVVANPAAFGISGSSTDRWKLRIPVTTNDYYINSADAVTDDAELVATANAQVWESEYVTLGTTFRIWRVGGGDVGVLLAAYYPARSST